MQRTIGCISFQSPYDARVFTAQILTGSMSVVASSCTIWITHTCIHTYIHTYIHTHTHTHTHTHIYIYNIYIIANLLISQDTLFSKY